MYLEKNIIFIKPLSEPVSPVDGGGVILEEATPTKLEISNILQYQHLKLSSLTGSTHLLLGFKHVDMLFCLTWLYIAVV